MKLDIHPNYFEDAKITCACGTTMVVGSTIKDISVELCSSCHPFYTGKQNLVDTAGRVEKFKTRASAKDVVAPTRVGKKEKKVRETLKKEEKAKETAA